MTEINLASQKLSANHAVILFRDGSRLFITEPEYVEVMFLDKEDSFIIRGNKYSNQKVDKILTLEEYRVEYPDKQPPEYSILDHYFPKGVDRKRSLGKMIEGLKQFISECATVSDNTLDLLKRMERKYEQAGKNT